MKQKTIPVTFNTLPESTTIQVPIEWDVHLARDDGLRREFCKLAKGR